MSSKRCWSFPRSDSFCDIYREEMGSDNMYLSEKTCPIARKWLAGKKVYEFGLVPIYAVSDFEEYLCRDNPKSPNCIATKMNSDIYFNQITRTLENMAKECDCDNDW